MSKKKFTKLLALYLPYVVIGLLATNLGEAWRKRAGGQNPVPDEHLPCCVCKPSDQPAPV